MSLKNIVVKQTELKMKQNETNMKLSKEKIA